MRLPGDSIFKSGYYEAAVKYFGKSLDYNKPLPEYADQRSFKRSPNIVGHQQRCFNLFWGISVCGALGKTGLDVGAGGIPAPFCLGIDHYAGGSHPVYGGTYSGHFIASAEDLTPHIRPVKTKEENPNHKENFGKEFDGLYSPYPPNVHAGAISPFCSGSFPLVIANHVAEHMQGDFAYVLRMQWLRVLEIGGYCAMVIPDHQHHNVFDMDKSHVHGWSPATFASEVLTKIQDITEVVEFDTLANHWSFNVVLRRIK